MPQFWLLKTEPSCWSWEQQSEQNQTYWDGVRNYQAQKHLRLMSLNALAFFYHTGKDKCIRGIVRIIKTAYPDSTDKNNTCVMVDVEAVQPLPQPVPLCAIKAHSALTHLALIKQPRLSVVPIDEDAWKVMCSMGGITL